MIHVALGQVEGIDTDQTISRVVAQCRRQMAGRPVDAGLVFISAGFDAALVVKVVNDAFPGIELVGCTTSGEFSSQLGFSDDSICLVTLASEQVEFKAGLGLTMSVNPEAAAVQAVAAAGRELNGIARVCIALPDGAGSNFNRLMAAFSSELGLECPVFGGCSSTQEAPFDHPIRQIYKTTLVSDAVPILLLAGPVEHRFAVANSWRPVGRRAKVTDVDGPIVRRIGERSAIDFYRHYLGDHSLPAFDFPLAVYESGADRFYMRGLSRYDLAAQSIHFAEAIPVGATVQLTEAVRTTLLNDTRNCMSVFSSAVNCINPALALSFSCSLRKEALGTRAIDELNIITQNLPRGLPVCGFFGYGEITPLNDGEPSFYHNATLATVVLGTSNRRGNSAAITLSGVDLEPQALVPTGVENRILQHKLARSTQYRRRLENSRAFASTMYRRIAREIDTARREIAEKEALLRKSEEKYRRIVETTSEGFLLMDENLMIHDVNEAYCRMVGYTKEELLGKAVTDLAEPAYRRFLITHREELLAKESRKTEGRLIARDGHTIPILVHGNTLRDSQGETIGHMTFVTDMTEPKKALLLAAEIQKNLLPHTKPQIPGIDVAGRSISCQEVGGDYYDFLWGPTYTQNPLSVVVGDITGHGVDAALLMTSARAFLRMRAAQSGPIADIVTAMNRHLTMDVLDTGRFMTLFYLTIDPAQMQLRWVRAGHDPAWVYDPETQQFDLLGGSGVALGLDENVRYTAYQKTGGAPGRIIVLGTDGIWEAFSPRGEMFGKNRLEEVIRANAHLDAQAILDAVYAKVDEFTEGTPPADDITLVVIKLADTNA